eukprot:12662307-Alexandrium_andersonii.AAC.1
MPSHTQNHADTQTRRHTDADTKTRTGTRRHTHTITHTFTHARTHTNTHRDTDTPTRHNQIQRRLDAHTHTSGSKPTASQRIVSAGTLESESFSLACSLWVIGGVLTASRYEGWVCTWTGRNSHLETCGH